MLLVDGNHLASRSRHSKSKHLCTSHGVPSAVVYGFFSGLSWAKNCLSIPTQQVIVFWDGGRSDTRMSLYPGYKAGRVSDNPTPEEIADRKAYYEQIDAVSNALPLLGIRSVKASRVEADDLLSIFAHMYASIGRQVVIFSGDKDLQQCASDRISIFDSKNELLTYPQLQEQWGTNDLYDIVKLKALAGDASDAIDGIPGIGPVRAKQLLPFWSDIFSDTPIPPLGGIAKLLQTARDHRKVVLRNVRIIRLPKVWSESFYSVEHALSVRDQLQNLPQRNTAAFIKFCKQWEMTTLIERIDQW